MLKRINPNKSPYFTTTRCEGWWGKTEKGDEKETSHYDDIRKKTKTASKGFYCFSKSVPLHRHIILQRTYIIPSLNPNIPHRTAV